MEAPSSDSPPIASSEASPEASLAAFAINTDTQALPKEMIHLATLSLLDWIAVAYRGVNEPVSVLVREMLAEDGGTTTASVLGTKLRLPARAAAMANGTSSHALDYDDTSFVYLGHPSTVVLSAALAVAERVGASQQAFIGAALIGMEAACRVGSWLGRAHYQAGFHQTATAGTFGASCAAARLLGLTPAQTEHALGLASTRAAGLKSQFGTMGKPFHAGVAAAAGIEAARLAGAGFVSNPQGLSGPQGFAQTHQTKPDQVNDTLSDLGTQYAFASVQHKFHACCHGLHASLEAISKLRAKHELSANDIGTITIATNPRFLSVCNLPSPVTGLEAKFSYRLTAAMAVQGLRTDDLDVYTDEICSRADLLALRDKVVVRPDQRLSDSAAIVRIENAAGQTLTASHDLNAAIDATQRETKVRNKAATLLGEELATRLWASINEPDRPAGEFLSQLKSLA